MTTIRRIGVLTGGGDCPGLNAVIRAVTKTAMHQYKLEVLGIEDGYLGLIQNRMRLLQWNDVSNILTLGGTILGTSNQANPQCFALERSGINCIGVPKTTDNDLEGCERTFGFDTAVHTAVECFDKIHTTAMSHHRVMVVEVMGRNAGWLALHSGVASGADVILIPEIPYDLDVIAAVLYERSKKGKRFSILCVSEGAKPKGGDVVVQRRVETSPDPIRLGGIANKLVADIEERTKLDARATVLGHIQRGGSPTPADRVLATQFGYHALEILMKGAHGQLVVQQAGRLAEVPIESVAGKQRKVPPDDPLVSTARAVGTCFGD
jgi:6-phosphofructokinase